MYSIIGLNTKQTYAEGSKAECFRTINEKFKFERLYERSTRGRKNSIYHEPLRVVRK